MRCVKYIKKLISEQTEKSSSWNEIEIKTAKQTSLTETWWSWMVASVVSNLTSSLKEEY
jgi:hypothetical protein